MRAEEDTAERLRGAVQLTRTLLIALVSLVTVPARAQNCPPAERLSEATVASFAARLGDEPGPDLGAIAAMPSKGPSSLEVRCVRAYALAGLLRHDEAALGNCDAVIAKYHLPRLPDRKAVKMTLVVGGDVTRLSVDSRVIYIADAELTKEGSPIRLSFDANSVHELDLETSCGHHLSRQLTLEPEKHEFPVGRSVQVAPAWTGSKIRIDNQLVSAWPVFLTGDEHVVSVEDKPKCSKRLGTDTTIEFEPSCRDDIPPPTSRLGVGLNSRIDFTPAGTQHVVGVLAGGALHFRIFDAFTPRVELGPLWSGEHVGVVAGLGAEVGRLSIFSLVPMVELAYTSISPSSGDTSVVALHPHLRLRFGSVKWAGYVSGGGYFILDKSLSSDDVIKRYVSLSLGFEGRWFP